MGRHDDEIIRVRQWNRELLLTILEADTMIDERQSSVMNLKSQMLIRAALHTIDVLLRVSYKDQEPNGTPNAMHRKIVRNTVYNRFVESAEQEYNFITARKMLIRAIRELDVEQEYDLLFLKKFDLGTVWEDDCYTISKSTTLEFPYNKRTEQEGAEGK